MILFGNSEEQTLAEDIPISGREAMFQKKIEDWQSIVIAGVIKVGVRVNIEETKASTRCNEPIDQLQLLFRLVKVTLAYNIIKSRQTIVTIQSVADG